MIFCRSLSKGNIFQAVCGFPKTISSFTIFLCRASDRTKQSEQDFQGCRFLTASVAVNNCSTFSRSRAYLCFVDDRTPVFTKLLRWESKASLDGTKTLSCMMENAFLCGA